MRRRVAVRCTLAVGGAAACLAGVALLSEGVAAPSSKLTVDRQDEVPGADRRWIAGVVDHHAL